MVLPDNQGSSPKIVLDDKAFEDSSNDLDFDVDLYLNDEEDNGNNVIVPQTTNLREENRDMFSSINEVIKLMLAMATNMSCVVKNDVGKEESKDNLKECDTLKVLDMAIPDGKLTDVGLEDVYMFVACIVLCLLIAKCSKDHLEGDALDLWIPALEQGGATI
ncbi:hypothetical protein Tco_1541310 [Tanacetum coccineum]